MKNDPLPRDRSFEGGAFHPNLPGGRASGTVALTATTVRFESDKGHCELPLDGIAMTLGGANDRLIFFGHPSQPQVSIYTPNHAVLQHPMIEQTPALVAQRGKVKTKKRTTAAVLLSVVALVVAAMVGVWMGRGAIVHTAAKTVPVDWEIAAGEKLHEQIVRTKRVIKDAELTAQLKILTGTLVQGIDEKKYPLTFHIIEDPTLNAFAIPGGNVVLHSGLLLAAETPEEVAGVLAHEIAHVTQRHSIRNIISSAGLYIALSAVIGDASGILAVVADNSAFLLDRSFSRDFEREADEVGWDYLRRSDIAPQGMIAFFRTMQKEEKKMLEKTPLGGMEKAIAVISTHPSTDERIERLEAKWQREEKKTGYKNVPMDYVAFKNKLRAQLHSVEKEARP